jgi:hypothetical protein
MSDYPISDVVLNLPIKRAWYEMIMRLEKPEEYREIKPYWTTRLRNAGLLDDEGKPTGRIGEAVIRAGYRPESPRAGIRFLLRIGQGRPEWGAEPGTEYYILEIILISGVTR